MELKLIGTWAEIVEQARSLLAAEAVPVAPAPTAVVEKTMDEEIDEVFAKAKPKKEAEEVTLTDLRKLGNQITNNVEDGRSIVAKLFKEFSDGGRKLTDVPEERYAALKAVMEATLNG